jgi:hypothetical protein
VIVLLVVGPEHAGFVTVKRLRLAIAFQARPGCFEVAESRFRGGEMQIHEPAGRIIHVHQNRAGRRAVFKPAMVAAIDLDQFANA